MCASVSGTSRPKRIAKTSRRPCWSTRISSPQATSAASKRHSSFMTDISHDFSQKPDLVPLAEVVQAVQMAAPPLGIEFFLMGAAARDLLLLHAHGIEGRGTEDIDFA